MAICLNTNAAYIDFNRLVHDRLFVDKSAIIDKISARINTKNRFICITKPRRFGKTSVLNMLGAYYCKAYDAGELFAGSAISQSASYAKDKTFEKASDALAAAGEQFIFIIDEWDYIFSHELYPKHQGDFLEYLRNLLKDKAYVSLVYMTGVLPIKKYSTGSALNMFKEYTMLRDPFFETFFGFTEEEVELLCQKQTALEMDEIREWYNGYQTWDGQRLYNPRSVVCALEDETCQSYWTRTGKMDEVLFFLKYNIGEVRDDVVKMINDIPVNIDIEEEYAAGQVQPQNREEIYAAMIIYGLLSYSNGELRIPNKELMIEFQKALKDDEFGYVAELVRN